MKSETKTNIQSFFSKGTLIIVGSGLSCSEGIPGMGLLAEYLIQNVPNHLLGDKKIWEQIEKSLKAGQGLEETLIKNEPDSKLEEIINDLTKVFLISKEKEIIQDVILNGRELKIEKLIERMPIGSTGLPVITTNYDRLIEISCEKKEIYIDANFLGRYYGKYNPKGCRYSFCKNIKKVKNTFIPNYQKRVKLYKPHGCFSWCLVNDEPISTNFDLDVPRLIITPGFNKYRAGYNRPFDMHREGANREIDNANKYIIIGYGFNDDHLETHLDAQIKSGKPTLVITYKLSEKAKHIVELNPNIIAVEAENETDSSLYIKSEKKILLGNKLWDLENFLKEVFNE